MAAPSKQRTGGAERRPDPRSRRVSALGEPHAFRDRPCRRCPWRTDCDLTDFTEEDMQRLRRADGRPGAEARPGASTVGCHLDQPGTAHPFRLCAGWLATVGDHHVVVRMALAVQAIPRRAVEPGPDWPALHLNLDALLAAWIRQLAVRAGTPAPGRRTS